MAKAAKKLTTLDDLLPDLRNANKGTERGVRVVEDSLTKYGAGRSILVDKHGRIIAGNKTAEAAVDKKFPLRVVQTDGHELVAVQRTDLDLDDATGMARALSIADNRASEVGLEWDADVLQEMLEEGLDTSGFWSEGEMEALLEKAGEDVEQPTANTDARLGDLEYRIIVQCTSEEHQAELLQQFDAEGLSCQALMS